MSGEEQPGTKVRNHIATAIVDGKPRHRILGLQLRYGQSLGPLDPTVRTKVEKIAARHGLDITRIKDWWWYADAPEGEPVPDHRLKRGDVVIIEGERGGAEFRSLQDPLEYYFWKGDITWQQARAGKKLYHHFRTGNMLSTYRTMKFDDMRGAHSDPMSKPLLSVAFRNAMNAISGDQERHIAFAVCCEGKYITGLEGYLSDRTARRKGKPRLITALDDLVKHFGIGKAVDGELTPEA